MQQQGHQIPIERKGRKHVIELTVPKKKEIKKGERGNNMKVESGNRARPGTGNDMDVDLFLRPAWKV